jgi:hypothetical protein
MGKTAKKATPASQPATKRGKSARSASSAAKARTPRKPAVGSILPGTISITEPYQRPPIKLGLLEGKIKEVDPNWWKNNDGEGWDEYLD